MEKAKYSEYDSKGHLCAACCECERDGNGSDKDKCSAGWQSKKWDYKSCFAGELMKGLTVNRLTFSTKQMEIGYERNRIYK